eukprot:8424746-Pyramimonas_sp.AAC.1
MAPAQRKWDHDPLQARALHAGFLAGGPYRRGTLARRGFGQRGGWRTLARAVLTTGGGAQLPHASALATTRRSSHTR